MFILLVIDIIGLFITLVNVLLFIETLSNEKEISREHENNLDCLDSINRKLNSVVRTVDRNNLKYETQFNDIWHRISRKGEPLDPDEVNEQVQQYFNMLDNSGFAISTTPAVVKKESALQEAKEEEHE